MVDLSALVRVDEDLFISSTQSLDNAGFKLNPIEFDKDLDDHMLFVTACSNLRALNYSIPTEDTHRSRAIAGRSKCNLYHF